MADKLLEIKGVSKIFRVGGMIRGKKLVAVDDVTLSIDNDKPVILSVVGESGCGKSTLCKMVLRLHNPDMGDIVLDGQSYRDKKSYNAKQFKLEVQPIFQNPYESFSARKPVDSYLFNTALRLGTACGSATAFSLGLATRQDIEERRSLSGCRKGQIPHPVFRRRAAACFHCTCAYHPSEADHCRRTGCGYRCFHENEHRQPVQGAEG